MDFSWSSAKASHVVSLCCMEQGEIDGWQEVRKNNVRRAHGQKHTINQDNNATSQDKNHYQNTEKLSLCVFQ